MKNLFSIIAAVTMVCTPTVAQASHHIPPIGPQELACVELQRGQYDEAIVELEKQGARASKDPAQLINLGTAYARTGAQDEAAVLFKTASSLEGDHEVRLETGRWVSHHRAARMALATLKKQTVHAAPAVR